MSRPTQVLVTGAAGSDTAAARETLGFEPKISIEEGIGRFADWLRGRP